MAGSKDRLAAVWERKPPTTGAREEARRVAQAKKIATKKAK